MPKGGNSATRVLFYLSLGLVLLLVLYKLYLNFIEKDFHSVHAQQVERIEERLAGRDSFRFAVVGNINNSIGIFERKMIPMLNESGVDFVISAGNAVSSGGEDKYRALHRTLSRLSQPYLLTFGEKEHSLLGDFRFYDHYGPYVFSFVAGNSRFLFIDSTLKTDLAWQLHWLEQELANSDDQYRFMFSGQPLVSVEQEWVIDLWDDYLMPESSQKALQSVVRDQGVDVVFSANYPLYSHQQHDGVEHVITGGAGGFVPDTEHGFYHYVDVSVSPGGVVIKPVSLDVAQHPFWRTAERLWLWIHSLFYVGYLNFILLLGLLMALSSWLYGLIFVERDYYPSFDRDPARYLQQPLRVAMFTNNYLPFIGGVPISIDRLRRGLEAQGHKVLIVAPAYHTHSEESNLVRVPTLVPLDRNSEFRLANLFQPAMYRRVKAFRPDIIHVHHPFWLGSAGLWLGRRMGIPVVLTYHTRLEHYAHYVPLPGPLFRNLVSHALVKHFANRCDAVVVPTQSAEEYLRMIGVRRPIHIQPTGIEYARFSEVDEEDVAQLRQALTPGGERLLLSISRLGREKNLDFLLDALHRLRKTCRQPVRLVILGEGRERSHLEKRIHEEGLQEVVLLPGSVPPERIPVYCRAADLFVFASCSETQGMVILEAMAAGLPVVTVRSSGIDDIVEQGSNGFKTSLDKEQWSSHIRKLLEDEPLRHRLSAAARVFAAEYDIAPFSQSLAELYAQALAQKDDAGPELDDG